jgi:hypothetical protein
VKNQDGEIIPNMTDYILVLQFIKHKSINKNTALLETLVDYLKQIFMMIGLQVFPSQTQPIYDNNNNINEF